MKRMLTGVSKIAGASDTLVGEPDQTAIEHIANTVCDILGCDRCSAFVYDKQNNELWAPSGVSSKVYRISDQNGIAGYVARTAECQNIKEVYNDPRFDNSYDVKTGYRTKTMMAVPIMSKEGSDVLGRYFLPRCSPGN
jgi:signal transduction protein with GAF and PtsI domain